MPAARFSKDEIATLFALHGAKETARLTGASVAHVIRVSHACGVHSPIRVGRPAKARHVAASAAGAGSLDDQERS